MKLKHPMLLFAGTFLLLSTPALAILESLTNYAQTNGFLMASTYTGVMIRVFRLRLDRPIGWMISFIIVIIAYNPIARIPFDRETGDFVDLVISVFLAAAAFLAPEAPAKQKANGSATANQTAALNSPSDSSLPEY